MKKEKWKQVLSDEKRERHDSDEDGSRITKEMYADRIKLRITLKDILFNEGKDQMNFDKAKNLTWEEIDNIKDI